MTAVLRISNGTTYTDFMGGGGVYLSDWTPAISGSKSVYSDSPIGDERRLVYRRDASAVETITAYITGRTMDQAIDRLRKLKNLIDSAKRYWTQPSHFGLLPVYIQAKAECETNYRYALIIDADIDSHSNPYAQPFSSSGTKVIEVSIVIERSRWLSKPPGTANNTYIEGSFGTIVGSKTSLYYSTSAAVIASPVDAATTSLHQGQFTVEGWFKLNSGITHTGVGHLFSKFWQFTGTNNWEFGYINETTGTMYAAVYTDAAFGFATISYVGVLDDGRWHHIAFQYDDSATSSYPVTWQIPVRCPEIYIDGTYIPFTELLDYGIASGTVDVEASTGIVIGNDPYTGTQGIDAYVGWTRVSTGLRYTPYPTGALPGGSGGAPSPGATGEAEFIYPNAINPLCEPPAIDASTVMQYNLEEGTGTSLDNASGDSSLDGTTTSVTIWSYQNECAEFSEETVSRPFVVNHHTYNYITDAYVYDASATSYTSNLIGTTLPYNILPNPLDTGDILYIGNTDSFYDGPFENVIFDILKSDDAQDPGGGMVIAWEYYNGSGWTQLTGTGILYDGTYAFASASINGVFWDMPSNWATGNLNTILGGSAPSVDGWWVRARITTAPSSNDYDIQQQNRTIYTACKAGVYLPAGTVSGDSGALAKISLVQQLGEYNHVLIGSKRGPASVPIVGNTPTGQATGRSAQVFIPFINIVTSGPQNHPNISVSVSGGGSIGATSLWPSGERGTSTHASTGTHTYQITISGDLASAYAGSYRAFATIAIPDTTGTDVFQSDLTYKVNDSGSAVAVGDTILLDQDAAGADFHTYEYGPLTISEDPNQIGQLDFYLTLESVDAGGGTAYIYQFILFPTDGDLFLDVKSADATNGRNVGHDGTNPISGGVERLDIDGGLINPREGDHAIPTIYTGLPSGRYLLSAPRSVIIPSTGAYIWFLFRNQLSLTDVYETIAGISSRVNILHADIYSVLRGSS